MRVVGLLIFFGVFAMMFHSFSQLRVGNAGGLHDMPRFFGFFPIALTGILVAAGGQALQNFGRAGLPGSEALLPAGAVQNHILEEPPAPQPEVRVRCRSCGYLETEDAKYCSGCGAQL